eukprot:1136157-Pelagomonas_calceolata.AAC.3
MQDAPLQEGEHAAVGLPVDPWMRLVSACSKKSDTQKQWALQLMQTMDLCCNIAAFQDQKEFGMRFMGKQAKYQTCR